MKPKVDLTPEEVERRDRFAIAALTGLLTDPSATGTPKARADAAYQLADAMLERRAKKEP